MVCVEYLIGKQKKPILWSRFSEVPRAGESVAVASPGEPTDCRGRNLLHRLTMCSSHGEDKGGGGLQGQGSMAAHLFALHRLPCALFTGRRDTGGGYLSKAASWQRSFSTNR